MGFYRQHADAVEVAKVSQILLLAESGKLHLSAGKNLDNLNVTGVYIDEDDGAGEKCANRKMGNVDSGDEAEEIKESLAEIERHENPDAAKDLEKEEEKEEEEEEVEVKPLPPDSKQLKDIDKSINKYFTEGMLSLQGEILFQINKDLGNMEKKVADTENLKDEQKLKVAENLPLAEQLECLEQKSSKLLKLDSNAKYCEEKQ